MLFPRARFRLENLSETVTVSLRMAAGLEYGHDYQKIVLYGGALPWLELAQWS